MRAAQRPLRPLAQRLTPKQALKCTKRTARRREDNPARFAAFQFLGAHMQQFHAERRRLIAELPSIPLNNGD
jgi:hypothetical protein